jgi:hypothetical protein
MDFHEILYRHYAIGDYSKFMPLNFLHSVIPGAGAAQSVGRPAFDPRQRQRIFAPASASRPALGARPASCTMGTRGPFPGGKVRLGHDADHSLPSSAEVKNEYELYLLSPQAPPWRVAGSLYLYLYTQ